MARIGIRISALLRQRHSYGIPLHPVDAATVEDLGERLNSLSMEIFSAPKPFVGPDKSANGRAIESWLRLSIQPKVTLLGDEPGYAEAAQQYNGVNIERRVDKTFLGVPLFNSMVDRANRSTADVAVIINGDIILTEDFIQTIRKVAATVRDYLVVAARYDVDDLPDHHASHTDLVRKHVVANGKLHTYGGMDLWAWNANGPKLFGPEMPHFIFGRGKYDNWMTHEAIAHGSREVIDATETALLVHVRHDYHLVSGADENHLLTGGNVLEGGSKRRLLNVKQFWSEGKRSKFELFINIFLSLHVGTYKNQMGSVLHAPWKLGRCAEPTGMCLVRRTRPGVCPCEYSGFTAATQTDPSVKEGSRLIRCGMQSVEEKSSFKIPVTSNAAREEAFGMPLTITSITEKVAINNTVILTALTFGYRDMMMNWVCNLRQLGITNFVIASLDGELYKYAYTRSLPTYYEDRVSVRTPDGRDGDAAYGSPSFKQITKEKSRVVLRLMKLGYNVLWSDCDIFWFRNPLPDLWSRNADLSIQSNAPDDEASNGRRRLNSGFYLAVSSPQLIKAFRDIVRYGAQSKMSEQPCFYDVLCGKDGSTAVGQDGCTYGLDVRVKVLPRERYPNGVTKKIWDAPAGRILDTHPGLIILHNNWVKGKSVKAMRFARHNMVTFDASKELCTHTSVIG